MMKAKAPGLAPVAFVAMVIFLGVNFVAVRFSNRELTPFWGAALRFVLASAILAILVLARRVAWPRGRALVGAALFGALAFGANFALVYWALRSAPASLASVLFATVPLLTLVMAAAAGQERLRARALVGALVAAAGAALVFADQIRTDVPLASILALLGAASCAALSGIVVKGFPRSHPLAANAVGMGVAAVMLLALAWAVPSEVIRRPHLAATWGALGWLVASSTIAFVTMVWLIGRWGPSRTSYSSVLSPIVTATVALAIAGEPITLGLAVGGVIVLAGVWLGAIAPRPKAPAPEKVATGG